MWRLSFGRPPAELVVEPGVLVVIGGGECERGRLETICCWALESTLWERPGGGAGRSYWARDVSKWAARDEAREETGVLMLFMRFEVDLISVTWG